MASLRKLEERIAHIEERNRKVESDKAWETSYSRRALLVLFTYVAVGAYLHAIGVRDAWLHAIVPAFAFMLSTLTLPFFKRVWKRNRQRAQN
ncbi:MAG: hypothetical protein HYY37_06705 [Candidatus Aenigmarchaeota archaeon]|nr:hypothetical protein [Candidatus Aenigmarchaeota archaeon]